MSSLATEMQKIVVALSVSDIAIEPGSVAQLTVTMTNHQEAPDRLLLDVEGIDVEWVNIPVSAVNVAPGAQTSERIIFKMGRGSESRAGSYPFLVRVQAMETGEIGVAQALLTVKPFSDLQIELNPKRGVATFFHPLNEFDITVTNLGNDEETVELLANDPDDECAYEFDMERVTLKPGQAAHVPMAMRPKSSSFLGGMRLYGFSVSARSTEDSYISANTHGQLEKRALISPLLGIFLLLLAFGSGTAYYLRPRPAPAVKIYKFNTDLQRVNFGDTVTLSWNVASGYKTISLFRKVGTQEEVALDEQPKPDQSVGSLTVHPQPPQTTYIINVTGYGDQKDKRDIATVAVNPPPAAPHPKIAFLKADPPIVHQGESLVLSWQATGADRLILDPGNIQLSNYEQTHQITPDSDSTYTLRVFGRDDKAGHAEKSVKVHVVSKDVCIAEILSFRAKSPTVYIGSPAHLSWKTDYARVVRIDSDRGAIGEVAHPAGGSLDTSFPLTEPTTFTLTATDSAGKSTTKTLTITPVARPVPVTPPTPAGDGSTTPPPDGTQPAPTPVPDGNQH